MLVKDFCIKNQINIEVVLMILLNHRKFEDFMLDNSMMEQILDATGVLKPSQSTSCTTEPNSLVEGESVSDSSKEVLEITVFQSRNTENGISYIGYFKIGNLAVEEEANTTEDLYQKLRDICPECYDLEMKIQLIDPPSGWKYGFPKMYIPFEGESMIDYCVRKGYPRSEANALDDSFNCQFTG